MYIRAQVRTFLNLLVMFFAYFKYPKADKAILVLVKTDFGIQNYILSLA